MLKKKSDWRQEWEIIHDVVTDNNNASFEGNDMFSIVSQLVLSYSL